MTNGPHFYCSLYHPMSRCEHYKADRCQVNSKSSLSCRFVLIDIAPGMFVSRIICTFVKWFLLRIRLLFTIALENMNNIFYCSVKSMYVDCLGSLSLIATNYCSSTFIGVTRHRQRFFLLPTTPSHR